MELHDERKLLHAQVMCAMYCSELQGWAEQKGHFPIPGAEPALLAVASTALQGLGGSRRGVRKPTYSMRKDWLTSGAEGSEVNEKDFCLLPGRAAWSWCVCIAACTRIKGLSCREQREAYWQVLILISLTLSWKAFPLGLCLWKAGTLALKGLLPLRGVQQRLGSTSWTISPDSRCHGEPLTDSADNSSCR